jgi:hypothetical protein
MFALISFQVSHVSARNMSHPQFMYCSSQDAPNRDHYVLVPFKNRSLLDIRCVPIFPLLAAFVRFLDTTIYSAIVTRTKNTPESTLISCLPLHTLKMYGR